MKINGRLVKSARKMRFASLLKLAGYLKAYFKDNALIESENWDYKSYKTH